MERRFNFSSSISYNAITSSGTRTAYIERARIGASTQSLFFPVQRSALIWAKGGTSFGNHGSSNRGFGSINLINQCNIATTILTTQEFVRRFRANLWTVGQLGYVFRYLVTAIGCDSVLEQSVQYTPAIVNTLPSLSICQGDSVQIFGTWISTCNNVV